MQLQKAWDKQALLDGLKQDGIEIAEPLAAKLLERISNWAEGSLALDGGVPAAVGIPLIALVKPLIKAQIDKIDPNHTLP